MATHSSELHVVVGAGATGSRTAVLLGEAGKHVKVLSRSGNGPSHPSVERIALDASDADVLARHAAGAVALYNCANPAYSKWAKAWPPLADSLLTAAERSGAVLATTANLYVYADPSEPMTEASLLEPSSRKGRIRADMWLAAKAAHDQGRIRATEVRASDFVGQAVGQNGHFGDRLVPKLLKGKKVSTIGDPDVLHSWTATDDVARALVTVASDPQAWGNAWHVPTAPPATQREMVARLCALAGVNPVRVAPIPSIALKALGLVVADIAELDEMRYQFDTDFIIDSTAFTKQFGWDHTPMDDTLKSVLNAYR